MTRSPVILDPADLADGRVAVYSASRRGLTLSGVTLASLATAASVAGVAASLATFAGRSDNPHAVTAAQVGAYSSAQADAAVDARIATLVGTAPANLDTLQELAAQLATDGSAVAALTTSIATVSTGLSTHAARADNPHGVTAAQLGVYTTAQVANLFATNARTDDLEAIVNAKLDPAANLADLFDAVAARANLGLGTAATSAATAFAAVAHAHAASSIVSGVLAVARLGTGAAASTNFLRGDGSWTNELAGPTRVVQLSHGNLLTLKTTNDSYCNFVLQNSAREWQFAHRPSYDTDNPGGFDAYYSPNSSSNYLRAFGVTTTGDGYFAGNTLRLAGSRTPASATAAGKAGDWCWDAAYFYQCVAANTWRRVAHATW